MDENKLINLFFEVGTLRKLSRSHRQLLLTDDLSDNIASHSFRVILIAYFLAQIENADSNKAITMAIFHDLAESRSGDQNWVYKKYVKVFEDELLDDQLSEITKGDQLVKIMKEYAERKTLEAKIAKDADLLDQLLLLKEYSNNGNEEAKVWLKERDFQKRMYTKTAKRFAKKIYSTNVHSWWEDLWTEKRR
jgi:putative hydrolase of HD superfamily